MSWVKFCGWALKAMGWTADSGAAPEDKCIILGAPHTSMWDFVVSYLFYTSTGTKAYVMVKDSFFKGPLKPIMKALGGIPMDRRNPTGSVKKIIDGMKEGQKFQLSMAPEGTRKPIRKWKTGYHVIARNIGCPVYLGYFDWGTKHIGIGEKFELTDDAKADTAKIQQLYKAKGYVGKHPEKYVTE